MVVLRLFSAEAAELCGRKDFIFCTIVLIFAGNSTN